MKAFYAFATLVLSLIYSSSIAQWQYSGSNIFNTNIGNVGIGTSSPSSNLEVYNNGVAAVKVRSTNGAYGLNFTAFQLDAAGVKGSFQASTLYPPSIRLGSHTGNPLTLFTDNLDRIVIVPDGRVGIGTDDPQELLHLNGPIRGNQSGALRISSGTGYLDVGSRNSSWAHFVTDRPRFYFNEGITVDGGLIGSYNGDLDMQTAGTTRLTIVSSNGFVGINNGSPSNRLDVGGDIRAINGWLKNTGDYGLFNETDSNYLYSDDINYWRMRSGRGLRIANKSNLTKGFLYHNDGDGFGLLDGDAQWAVRIEKDNFIGFYVNGSQRMHLTAAGALGVGVTQPTEMLDVNGTGRLRGMAQNNSLTRSLVSDANGKIFWRDANLASQSLIPSSNNVFDLGSEYYSFRNLHLGGDIHAGQNLFLGGDIIEIGSSSIRIEAESGSTFIYSEAADGDYSTIIGKNAGRLSSGNSNTFVGYHSGYFNDSGFSNTFIGFGSGYANSQGDENVFVGHSSGKENTTGGGNIFLGQNSGWQNKTGSFNIAIGNGAGPAFENISNSIAIGENARVYANDKIVLGTTHSVGIRQSLPQYALHVQSAYCDGFTWYNASDRNLKKNFRAIGNEGILDKLSSLEIQRWTYKEDSTQADHIGPVAQEFNRIFGLGSNTASISTVDEIGVALAAIKELDRKTKELQDMVLSQSQLISGLMNTVVSTQSTFDETDPDLIRLYQNIPNPFSVTTEIRMVIPASIQVAFLMIYDASGKQLAKEQVPGRGHVTHIVEGNSLVPGLYFYTVIGDGKAASVKRMILTD